MSKRESKREVVNTTSKLNFQEFNDLYIELYKDGIRFLNELKPYIREQLILISGPYSDKLNIRILNYGRTVQASNDLWNPYTELARCLIINYDTGEICGRSFFKFFNHSKDLGTDKIKEVTKKFDGSLINIFYSKDIDDWIICSKASFNSPHVEDAKRVIKKKYLKDMKLLDKSLSHSFELISPLTTNVINYKKDELVYLRSFKLDSLEDLYTIDPNSKFAKAEVIDHIKLLKDLPITVQSLKGLNTENEEGYVVILENDIRCKVKFELYNTKHKCKSNPFDKSKAFDAVLNVFTSKEATKTPKLAAKVTDFDTIYNYILEERERIEIEYNKKLDQIIKEVTEENKDNEDLNKLIIKALQNDHILINLYTYRIDTRKDREMKYKPFYRKIKESYLNSNEEH